MNKKIYYFFFSCLTLFTSCTGDAIENINNNNSVLPKALKCTEKGSSEGVVTTFLYDGNKIVSSSNKFEKIIYSYDDDKIVKEIKYHLDGNQEVKYCEANFTYKDNHLKTAIVNEYGYQTKYEYTINDDGTIVKTSSELNEKKEKEPKSIISEVLTFKQGNLIKKEQKNQNEVYNFITITNYEYDTSNNAFKNILGLNLLLDLNKFSTNNIEKIIILSSYQSEDFRGDYINSFKYKYNDKGYPVRAESYGIDGLNAVIEYVY